MEEFIITIWNGWGAWGQNLTELVCARVSVCVRVCLLIYESLNYSPEIQFILNFSNEMQRVCMSTQLFECVFVGACVCVWLSVICLVYLDIKRNRHTHTLEKKISSAEKMYLSFANKLFKYTYTHTNTQVIICINFITPFWLHFFLSIYFRSVLCCCFFLFLLAVSIIFASLYLFTIIRRILFVYENFNLIRTYMCDVDEEAKKNIVQHTRR